MARTFVRSGLSPRQGLQRLVRPLLLLAAALMAWGVAGGLVMLGALPPVAPLSNAAVSHGALMVGGLFGTVIGIERAVALRTPWAFLAPAGFAAGALITVLGMPRLGAAYLCGAAVLFTAVNVALMHRQLAAHTVLLVAGAVALTLGCVSLLLDGERPATVALWFLFLLTTIAAERLEMARLMVRRPGTDDALYATVTLLAAGAVAAWVAPAAGGALFGLSTLALAVWLLRHDIARHTLRTAGLSRYMAVCLLTGYVWLAVGGTAWSAWSLGVGPARDLALHAIGLGFVVAMVMAHAPVILPAVAGIKVAWHPALYAPLGLLQASLLVRAAGGLLSLPSLKAVGGAFNLLALLAFGVAMAAGAGLWRRRHPAPALPPVSPAA